MLPTAGSKGGRAEWGYVQEAKGVQSLNRRFGSWWQGDHGKMRQVERQLPIWPFWWICGFDFYTASCSPRGCLPAGPQTRRWDTVHGSSLALKWTWPCPDGAQSIPTPNCCWCSLKFPGVTWQLLKYEPSLWSPPTSCLLAPDLISPQAFPCVHLTECSHYSLEVGTTCYPILLMGNREAHTGHQSNSTGI